MSDLRECKLGWNGKNSSLISWWCRSGLLFGYTSRVQFKYLNSLVTSLHPLEIVTCLRPVNPDFVYLSIILADRNSAEPRLPRVFFAMSRSAASFLRLVTFQRTTS